jgi:hypothetical protein
MMIQVFTSFPLLQQAETVFIFDIAKNAIAYATHLLFRRLDHGEKGLRYFQMLIRDGVHGNFQDDHLFHGQNTIALLILLFHCERAVASLG